MGQHLQGWWLSFCTVVLLTAAVLSASQWNVAATAVWGDVTTALSYIIVNKAKPTCTRPLCCLIAGCCCPRSGRQDGAASSGGYRTRRSAELTWMV